jgi:hypothetical protein
MDDYERSSRRLALIEPATLLAAKIRHARALQHLKEGFNRRVLMLDATIRHIHDQVDQAGGRPLSAGRISELAIFVNAFWLNVCGALDNLAWAVNYEFGIIPAAAEESGPARLQIKLFHKRFRTALVERQPELAKEIAPFEEWYEELAEMRDPGAHRIPIYPIPGVMDSTTAAEAERLYTEGTALMEAGSWDEGMELIHQGYNLGSYQPWIALSHNGRIELRNLLVEVRRDEEQFVHISNIILRALFK